MYEPKKYTRKEFLNKVDWEGGFDAMADYQGHAIITDDQDLHEIYNAYVNNYDDLRSIMDDWEGPEDEDEDEE